MLYYVQVNGIYCIKIASNSKFLLISWTLNNLEHDDNNEKYGCFAHHMNQNIQFVNKQICSLFDILLTKYECYLLLYFFLFSLFHLFRFDHFKRMNEQLNVRFSASYVHILLFYLVSLLLSIPLQTIRSLFYIFHWLYVLTAAFFISIFPFFPFWL